MQNFRERNKILKIKENALHDESTRLLSAILHKLAKEQVRLIKGFTISSTKEVIGVGDGKLGDTDFLIISDGEDAENLFVDDIDQHKQRELIDYIFIRVPEILNSTI